MEESNDGNSTPEELEKRAKTFESLKKFYKRNMNVKNTLLKLSPSELDDSNEETRGKYVDKLYKELRDIEREFLDIVKDFDFGSYISKAIKQHFEKTREKLYISHYDRGVIRKIFEEQFYNMHNELIDEVKEQCVGYTMFGANLEELISKSKTINELLHVMHSYISNNEVILQAMPIIDSKENLENYPITLYGEETEISRKLFEDFPVELSCGWTEIISMQGKILMMVRDRGHALTIDIDTSKENDIFVKYFVPKLCNIEMIQALPGINKNSISQNGAVGVFRIKDENLSEKLFDFIEKVPTDFDMKEVQEIFERREKEESENKENISTPFFKEEDAKELVMDQGEKGRRTGNVVKIKEMLKNTIYKLRSKNIEKDSQDIGGNTNDKTGRDL